MSWIWTVQASHHLLDVKILEKANNVTGSTDDLFQQNTNRTV
jgi:hypothetical protein